jgi:argininosuccinate lyase
MSAGEPLHAVSDELLGARLAYAAEEIAQIMSPRHFVDVRRTLGGPAPQETARAVAASREAADRDAAWIFRRRDALAAAERRLKDRSRAL